MVTLESHTSFATKKGLEPDAGVRWRERQTHADFFLKLVLHPNSQQRPFLLPVAREIRNTIQAWRDLLSQALKKLSLSI